MVKYTVTLVINYELHCCVEQYDTANRELIKVAFDMKRYGIKTTGFVHKMQTKSV